MMLHRAQNLMMGRTSTLKELYCVRASQYFKLGMKAPKLSVSERPLDVDTDCKTKKQNFSLRSAIIECQAMLKGKTDHKVNKHPATENHEHTVDESRLEGASKKFKGDVTHSHLFGSTTIEPQHSPVIPPVSMIMPSRQDEPAKSEESPLMAHSGLTSSVKDSSLEGPPKKFIRDYSDKV
ncbi:Desmoglein-1 [Labeo rohita]|uniref:Desmoglein-1 n=1 Tax=Labeo rohita TaxID=84645 RepID=A0ABQ8M8D6_LABRO|nr:Desmoglein-1 [Labeo rohita]